MDRDKVTFTHYVSAIEANKALETEGITGEALANEATEAQRSEKETITQADIDALRSIGRKSVTAFTSEDIKKAEPFARRMWDDLKEKSPFFRTWFGDWRANDNKTTIKTVEIKETIIPYDAQPKNIGVVLRNKLKNSELFRGTIKNNDTKYNIQIGAFGYNDTLTYAQRELRKKGVSPEEAFRRVNALTKIDELIQNAVLFDTEVINDEDNINRSLMHIFYGVANVGGVDELIKIKVDELESPTNPTKRFYNLNDFEIINKKPLAVNWDLNPSTDTNGSKDKILASISIADLFQLVKTYDNEFNPKEASKVVNADGTPKIMYHGSREQFTVFDKKKAKASGAYGKGFYFTDSDSHAKQYGNTYAVYLDIKNPLKQGESNVTEGQIRKFLETVAENEDYSIENYGTYDVKEILSKIESRDAFSVIQDINATAIGDMVEAVKLWNDVNGTSFDGIIVPTETVVFEPTQIKSATDNIGTFDKGNEDIRFSEKDYGRITADMSDAERTKILSKKSIVAPIYEGQADSLIKANSVNLNSEKISTVKNAIVRIGEEFGVIGNEIRIDDVEVVITPSRKNLKESLSKETTPTELARLLPVLKESVSKAIGVERHDNRYYFDSDTVYFENLLGGYVDGKEFVPVRFGLKHSKTGNTVLYVVVDQNRIPLGNLEQKNKTEVVNTAGPIKTEQTVSRSVEYSISQVIAFVKSKDLLRYIPDNMLSSEQKNVKWEAIAETIKTTNKKNDKKYSEFIANENLRAANEMVAQAAKANGYTLKAYHGGNHFFTVFGKGNKTSSAPDGAYFFTDNMDVAYSYTAYKNIVDLNVNNHPIYKQATPDGRIEENRVSHGGVYPVYLKLQNPYIVDFEGRYWGNKVNGMDINEIAVWAKENGYDGVIAKNIIDAGDMGDVNYEEGNTRVPSTDYIIFDSARAKSSETITYDDEGNIIPISERFNQENDDIRFSEKDYGTSAYDLVGEHKTLEKRYKKLEADFENYKERVKLDRTLTRMKYVLIYKNAYHIFCNVVCIYFYFSFTCEISQSTSSLPVYAASQEL